MATATAQAVQLLNLAYFGRPADPASLTAWQAAGMTQSQVVEVFVGTSEYTTNTVTPNSTESGGVRTYNMTNFINTLYNRLVGRDAAASEISGWSDAVSSGAVNHDYLGITLVNAILNLDESVEMRKVMIAKLDSANLYSDYLATDAADLSAYSTTAGLASGRSFNDSVTTTTAKTYAEVVAVADLLDNPSKYTLTATSASATEGSDVTIAISLDSAPTEAVTVNYVTANGSATSADYTSASGTVTFAAGQTTQYVTVKTTADTDFEEDETFTVTFSGTRLNASVQAVGTISNDDANPTTSASTFTLTTGSNTFTGLDGDDTFDASTSNSLSTFDTLVGGGGTDTLNATLDAAANLPVNTTGIEQINFTAGNTNGASSVNMEHTAGVTGITSVNSTQNLTLQNIQSAITSVTIQNGTAETLTLDYDASAIAGTSDDVLITLDDVVANNVTLTRDSGTTNTVETVSLHSISEANTIATLDTSGVGTTKLEVTGDQSLGVTTISTDVNVIDGSAATGALTFTVTNTTASTVTGGTAADSLTGAAGTDSISGGAGNDTISSLAGNDTIDGGAGADSITAGTGNDSVVAGAGDDILNFAAGELDENDTVDGGTGTDQIKYSADETVVDNDFTGVTNVSTLTSADDKDIDYTLSTKAAAAGVTTINFAGDAASDSDSVTVEAGFTNNLTVDLDGNGVSTTGTATANSVVATNYTGSLTVTAADTDLDANAGAGSETVSTITGGTGSDTLKITATGGAVTSTMLGSVTKVETFELVANGTNSTSVTISDANSVGTGATTDETLTIDGSGMTAGITLIDATAEDDSKIVIKGGSGADRLVGSASANHGDTITGGAGNDTIAFANANVGATDSVDGGAGTDVVEFQSQGSGHAVIDDDFTLFSNVETVTTTADAQMVLTLDDQAAEAGINKVIFNDTTNSTDTLTVGANFTNNLSVTLTNDTNEDAKIDASAYTKSLTVIANDSDIDTNVTTITGGTGSDTLQITTTTGSITISDTALAAVTAVEKFEVLGDDAIGITLDNNNAAADATLTVDASAATGIVTLSASDEQDGKVVITTGTAADVVTVSNSTLGDNINTGAGNDDIKVDNGDLTSIDTIAGGAGDDELVFISDVTMLDAAFTNVTSVETIKGVGTDDAVNVTLGQYAAAAGVTTVNFSDTAAVETLTVGSGFTNNLTVALDNDDDGDNAILASAYTGVLTVTVSDAHLDDGTEINTITGGTGSDILSITASATNGVTLEATDLANITNVETFKVAGTDVTNAFIIAVDDANAGYTHASDYHSLTIDTTATSGVATISATAETDSKIIITTGAGADVITVSNSANFGDNISTGAGDDDIKIDDGDLTNIDTINGGAGTDEIVILDDVTLLDAAFTNVSNVEAIKGVGTDDKLVATLGQYAAAAGITTVTFSDTAAVETLTVGSGFTNDLSVTMDADNSSDNAVIATNYTKALTVNVAAADMNSGTYVHTVTGGTGTDVLKITAASGDAALVAADFASITKVETFQTVGNEAFSATISDNNAVGTSSSTETLTIDATSLTTAAATIDASAEDDAKVSITTGGGADTITASASSSYTDTVVAGAGADTINATVGADSLTGGTGADTFVYTAVNQSSSTSSDTITDFTTGEDKLNVTLDYSSLTSGVTVNSTIVTAAAGVTAVQNSLSGERGQYIFDSTNNKIYVNVNNDNLITTLDYHINSSTTNTSGVALADGDVNFNITGATGADTITSGGGADTISGGAGADTITGGGGADSISGGAAGDTLVGGAGADTLVGGAGDDSLTGGTGIDTFTVGITSANGTDSITDFTGGASGDVLGLGLSAGTQVNSTTGVITTVTATVLATQGDSIAVADGTYYVINKVANIAAVDTIAELVTALTDGGVLDAVDLSTTANHTGALVITAADDDDRVLVYGYTADTTTTSYLAAEFALVADIHTEASALAAGTPLVGSNFA